MTTNSLPRSDQPVLTLQLNIDTEIFSIITNTIFSTAIIFNILIDVPWNKTAGNFGVCYDLIEASDISVISHLSNLFKIMFIADLIPLSWTRSMINPVPKKGNMNEIKNYRPISLTESIRMIFEHCITRLLSNNVEHCIP
jgi:hypothetical protein